jgi:hypothetical protein
VKSRRAYYDNKGMLRKLFALVCGFLLATHAALLAQSAEDFGIRTDAAGITIIGYAGASVNVRIPVTIRGVPVVALGKEAFRNNQLISVALPSGLMRIDDLALSGNKLTSVTIPQGVSAIGSMAFAVNALTSVTIPDSVTSLGDWAFFQNELTSVTLPHSITELKLQVFASNKLSTVTIPPNVVSIAENAFADNPLTRITIGSDVRLEKDSFDDAFITCYNSNSKKGGIYRRFRNGNWEFME